MKKLIIVTLCITHIAYAMDLGKSFGTLHLWLRTKKQSTQHKLCEMKRLFTSTHPKPDPAHRAYRDLTALQQEALAYEADDESGA